MFQFPPVVLCVLFLEFFCFPCEKHTNCTIQLWLQLDTWNALLEQHNNRVQIDQMCLEVMGTHVSQILKGCLYVLSISNKLQPAVHTAHRFICATLWIKLIHVCLSTLNKNMNFLKLLQVTDWEVVLYHTVITTTSADLSITLI